MFMRTVVTLTANNQYGYNRDHDNLKQVNLGMFSATKSKLPVYYENYNGSLTDKVNLIPVIQNAKCLGISQFDIVMDGGFFDKEKIKKLKDYLPKFTVGMPSHLEQSKELIEQYINEIYNIAHSNFYESNYALITETEVFGIREHVMIGLNTQTRDLITSSLMKDIEKREKELQDKKIKKYETVISKKRYTELFDIEKLNEKDYTFKRNQQKIAEIAKNYGYYLIFTTDKELSANDILYYYREKDVDEKMFYQLKDYMNARRMHTQNQETTNGKIFVLFIALIIRCAMYQKLSQYMRI